ncbi:hypothetical protein [Actinomadura sp. NPDC000600]|uniref:hypothetical protein n=1 Tax=Actinomadura sp. NPDC000600 TaxID=3154262 RepID=UPI003399E966
MKLSSVRTTCPVSVAAVGASAVHLQALAGQLDAGLLIGLDLGAAVQGEAVAGAGVVGTATF